MLNKFTKSLNLIIQDPLATIIIACSGGSDSVALSHLLALTSNEHNYKLVLAHVNHNIRGETEHLKDIELIRKLGSIYNLEVHIKTIDKATWLNDSNIEATARTLRYKALQEVATLYEHSYIALAHTKNDQIETTYMRFINMYGYEGLAGIKAKRENYIRPLLDFTKDELEKFLKNNIFSWCIDSTNYDTKYQRNQIRQNIANIEQIDKNFSRSLLSLNKKMQEVEEVLTLYITEAWQFVWVDHDSITYSLDLFEKYPALLQKKLLLKGCNILGKNKLPADFRIKDNMFNGLIYTKNNPIIFKNRLFTLYRQKRLIILSLTT